MVFYLFVFFCIIFIYSFTCAYISIWTNKSTMKETWWTQLRWSWCRGYWWWGNSNYDGEQETLPFEANSWSVSILLMLRFEVLLCCSPCCTYYINSFVSLFHILCCVWGGGVSRQEKYVYSESDEEQSPFTRKQREEEKGNEWMPC